MRPYDGSVADPSLDDDSGPGLLTKVVLAGIAAFVVLTVIGWIVGALISALRIIVVVAVAGIVIVTLVRGRGE